MLDMLLRSKHVEMVLNRCYEEDSLRVCCAVFAYGAKKLIKNYPQAIIDIKTLERISYEPLNDTITLEKNKVTLKKFIGHLNALKKNTTHNSEAVSYKNYSEYKKLSEQLDKENTTKKHGVESCLYGKVIASFNKSDTKPLPPEKQVLDDPLKQSTKQNWSVAVLGKKPRGPSKSHFESIVKSKYLKNVQSKVITERKHGQLAYSTAYRDDKLIPRISNRKQTKESIVEMTNTFLKSSIIGHFARGCTIPGAAKSQTGRFTRKKSRIWEDKILEEESSYATTDNNCNYSATSYTSSNVSIGKFNIIS
jgi:hypothetical protein